MTMSLNEVRRLVTKIGFNVHSKGIYRKYYVDSNCHIEIDLKNQKILYPTSSGMTLVDQTTSNFAADENFVVLECVDRLLRKGYPADRIELEKKWSLGRRNKGKLDILVKNKTEDTTFLMIECKTLPEEYENERTKMLSDGGQLFSYWQQDRSADILCLYGSRLMNKEIVFENSIVLIEDSYRKTGDVQEAFQRWNKQFRYKGIF